MFLVLSSRTLDKVGVEKKFVCKLHATCFSFSPAFFGLFFGIARFFSLSSVFSGMPFDPTEGHTELTDQTTSTCLPLLPRKIACRGGGDLLSPQGQVEHESGASFGVGWAFPAWRETFSGDLEGL